MRGIDHQQSDMFSYLSPEQRVRKDHPLRTVRAMTDEILNSMSPLFDAMSPGARKLTTIPDGVNAHRTLRRVYDQRRESITTGKDIFQTEACQGVEL